MTNPGIEVPGGVPAAYGVLSEVARRLAQAHGQRQFYSLAQVQHQAAAVPVDAVLSAWVYAAFVTRADFDAFFAMREAPGGYVELRAAMSPPGRRAAPVPRDLAAEIEAIAESAGIDDDGLWWLLELAAAP